VAAYDGDADLSLDAGLDDPLRTLPKARTKPLTPPSITRATSSGNLVVARADNHIETKARSAHIIQWWEDHLACG
jgi:hypothetical protein